ncbi:MAG: alpha/beta hydrolase [Methanocorpusculum sp.]|nr:alpha/beta hydrolase [Methanocorpusculum sp.]
MSITKFNIGNIPAILLGEKSDKIYIFVHGKSGSKEEAKAFAEIACPKGYQVLGIDLPEHGERKNEFDTFYPWNAVFELIKVMEFAKENWNNIALRANSIGAWFSMLALSEENLSNCLFVSPILDMNKLILKMMSYADVSEEKLKSEKIIQTEFGETLSWKYYLYAKEHPVKWNHPTSILYAGCDNLTERFTVDEFVKRFNCKLSVMENGEHWFHTPEQLTVLRKWEEENI